MTVVSVVSKIQQHVRIFRNNKGFCTISSSKAPDDNTVESSTKEINDDKTVRSFDEVPGPRGFLGIGTLFEYLPVIGHRTWDKMHLSGMKKYNRYGSIVRERLLPGKGASIVYLFDPDDIAKVLNEKGPGLYPCRRSHLALKKYRQDRPDVYKSGGLLPTNGEEWWKLRSELQKGLSSPKNVRNFLPIADEVIKEFIDEIRINDKNGLIIDFLPELERLNLELVCLIAFDVRLDAFSSEEKSSRYTTSSKLIRAAKISNSLILPLDQGLRLWRWYETHNYKRLRKAQEYIEQIAFELVMAKLNYFHEDSQKNQPSLLDGYLGNPNLNLQDVVGMACDLLLAGVDTSSYTTSYALYHLGTNLDVQEKLFNEARKILPDYDDDVIDATVLNNEATYTRAVLKESLRLNPIAIGVGRILNKDTVLSNYLIPKGTIIVTQTQVASLLEKNFELPDTFIPDRWLRSSDNAKPNINPYVSLPFGHGSRACIARRFAEQNIIVFLIRFFRKYKVRWMGYPRMEYSTKLINVPDQPICIQIEKRE